MCLGRPERQRRRQQESSSRGEHRDANGPNACIGPDRTRTPSRTIRPRIRSGHPQPQHRRPDVNALPDQELTRPREPLVVEEGAVLASEILEEQLLTSTGEARVPPADRRMRQPQVAAARPSEDQRALTDRQQLARSRTMLRIEEDLLRPHPADRCGHRRRTDGVSARPPLAPRAHRIRRHPLGRRVVRVQWRRLTLVERQLPRILCVLRAVLGWRSPWRSLGIRWRHARFAEVPHPPAVQ